MYVARVPNRGSPPAILLRESYREGGQVKNRTLANLSRWPDDTVDALARLLKGLPAQVELVEAFEITRSLPHGHVAAVLGTARRLGIEELIDPAPSRKRDLVLAMLIAQVITPGSKLAFARALRAETATCSLGAVLRVGGADEDDLYAAMDWVLARKDSIENALAARHLANGTLVLYDVSSAALEGRCCPLGRSGTPATGSAAGCRSSPGCCAPPPGCRWPSRCSRATPPPQDPGRPDQQAHDPVRLARVCLVGDRACSRPRASATSCAPAAGLDYRVARPADQGPRCADALQLSLFDEQNLVEISSPDTPASGWCAAATRP